MSNTRDLRTKRITEAMNAAFIDWLHKDHPWVPGSAELAREAFEAGYAAALNAAADLLEDSTLLKRQT